MKIILTALLLLFRFMLFTQNIDFEIQTTGYPGKKSIKYKNNDVAFYFGAKDFFNELDSLKTVNSKMFQIVSDLQKQLFSTHDTILISKEIFDDYLLVQQYLWKRIRLGEVRVYINGEERKTLRLNEIHGSHVVICKAFMHNKVILEYKKLIIPR